MNEEENEERKNPLPYFVRLHGVYGKENGEIPDLAVNMEARLSESGNKMVSSEQVEKILQEAILWTIDRLQKQIHLQ